MLGITPVDNLKKCIHFIIFKHRNGKEMLEDCQKIVPHLLLR